MNRQESWTFETRVVPATRSSRVVPSSLLPEATLRQPWSDAVGRGGDGRPGDVGGRRESEGREAGRPDGELAVVPPEEVPLLLRQLLQALRRPHAPLEVQGRDVLVVAAEGTRRGLAAAAAGRRRPRRRRHCRCCCPWL